MGPAAVPRDRCETYEAGGLGVLETPEFGRLDDEHVCGHLADAWNVRQDVKPLAQVCVAQCFEASIDRFDLAVDLAQPLSELTLDEGETAMAWRLRAATRSLMSASRALTSSLMT
jgi:hypothetical protein